MRCCRDASGSIDLDAFVSRAGCGGLAGVQAHPNPDGRALGPVVRGESPLALDGGGERVLWACEYREEGVTFRPDLSATVFAVRIAEDRALRLQEVGIVRPQCGGQLRRPLDVAEQEGHSSGRQL